jgi:hypothetical protein
VPLIGFSIEWTRQNQWGRKELTDFGDLVERIWGVKQKGESDGDQIVADFVE